MTCVVLILLVICILNCETRVRSEYSPAKEDKMLEADSNGWLSLTKPIDVRYLPAKSLKFLDIISSTSWDNTSEPIFLENLVRLSVWSYLSEINPNSLIFSPKLKSVTLFYPTLVNGTLSDLLKTATHLVALSFISMEVNLHYLQLTPSLKSLTFYNVQLINGTLYDAFEFFPNIQKLEIWHMVDVDVDVCLLPYKTLTNLKIKSDNLNCSVPEVEFEKLSEVNFEGSTSYDSYLLENFYSLFKNLTSLTLGERPILSPATVTSFLLSSNLKYFTFVVDFDPPVKSHAFGALMKILNRKDLYDEVLKDDRNIDTGRLRYLTLERGLFDGKEERHWKVVSMDTFKPFVIDYFEFKPQGPKTFIYIYFSILTFLILVGIVGNTLSAVVLAKKNMKNSAGVILLSLTLFDFLVIVTYLISLFFNAQIFYNLFIKTKTTSILKEQRYPLDEDQWMSQQNNIQAFFIYPLNKTVYTGSVYTTVLISFERFIAICWPLQSNQYLRTKMSKLGIMGVTIFAIVLNFPRWIESIEWNLYSEFSVEWNDYYRPTLLRIQLYKTIYHGWIWTVVMYFLPFILVAFFNLKIHRQLQRSRELRKTLQAEPEQSETSMGKTEEETEFQSLTRMLLCVVLVFVLCNSVHIGIVFYFLLSYEHIELSTIEAVSCLPLVINSSVNFIIYIFLGKTLRAEFYKLIPKWLIFWRRRREETEGIELTTPQIPQLLNCPLHKRL